MKIKKKRTNNFEYAIFGIDRLVLFAIKVIKEGKIKKTKKISLLDKLLFLCKNKSARFIKQFVKTIYYIMQNLPGGSFCIVRAAF
mgnify:CR=1 FL=1